MSPLPPGSTASTICGNRSHRSRIAWACTLNTFGMLMGEPATNGTAPSHTSGTFSMQLIDLNAPPLPPQTYPYGR